MRTARPRSKRIHTIPAPGHGVVGEVSARTTESVLAGYAAASVARYLTAISRVATVERRIRS